MILRHCISAVDEYSFRLKNTVSQETYDNTGVDWNLFTNVTLKFRKVNDSEHFLELDITDRLQYLFECNGGLVVNFEDFGQELFNGFNYFPDWIYESTITYTYEGNEYSNSSSTGFKSLISRVVYQQTKQSDWKNELGCHNCGCEKNSTVLRKWNYLWLMDTAAQLCLINEFHETMKALYKLTRTIHEFDQL